MTAFLEWCQTNALSQLMSNGKWPYPALEILHIAGLVVVFGSMLVLNLRIFGRILWQEPVPQVAAGLAPLTLAGVAAQLVSGPILFMGSAMKLSESTSFKLKMLLLLAALAYHFAVHRRWALHADAAP